MVKFYHSIDVPGNGMTYIGKSSVERILTDVVVIPTKDLVKFIMHNESYDVAALRLYQQKEKGANCDLRNVPGIIHQLVKVKED